MKTQAQFTFSKVRHDQDNESHLVISLMAPKVDWQKKRPTVCITLVADVSGSMGDRNKIEYAKKSMLKLVDNLQPGDYCGLVAFESCIHSIFSPIPMTPDQKERLKAEIGKLRPMGGTDFCGGMLQGLDFANKMDLPEGTVNRIILFTDGQANQGVATKREQLVTLLTSNLGKATLSAFGYGTDADQELLADVAKAGKGNYAFIKNPDDALSAFGKELGGLLSTYAQNLELKIESQNGHCIQEVVSDVDVVDDAGKLTVKIPDIMGEETRHIVVKMKLTKQPQALPREMNVVSALLRYDMILPDGTKSQKEESVKAKIRFVKVGDEQAVATPEVDAIVGLAQLVKTQIEAENRANLGDYVGAQSVMNNFSGNMAARGLATLSSTSSKMAHKMCSAAVYSSNSGYLKSAKAGITRGMGVSSMDAEAAEDLVFSGVSLSNGSQQAYQAAFENHDGAVGGTVNLGGGGSVTGSSIINNPAVIPPLDDKEAQDRAKQIQDFLKQHTPVDLAGKGVPASVPPPPTPKSLTKQRSKRW